MQASTSLNKAYPSFIGNFFTYLKCVELTESSVIIHFKFGKKRYYPYDDFIGFPKKEDQLLHSQVILGDAKSTQIRLLNRKQATIWVEGLEKQLQYVIISRIKKAQQLLKNIAFDEYLRDSSLSLLSDHILPLLKNYRANQILWHKYIEPKSLLAFKTLSEVRNINELVDKLRGNYEKSALLSRQHFYDVIEAHPLTLEQRLAAIRDNDRNLILAAAGTGKTSVMVAKALDLLHRQTATADQVLILAYNKEAANELSSRFSQCASRLSGAFSGKLSIKARQGVSENNGIITPKIMTFHSLAMHILTQCKRATTLSDFAKNSTLQVTWLKQWLTQQLHSNELFISKLLNTAYAVGKVCAISTDNNSVTNYQTLAGYKVRHYPEYIIANYLYLNKIPHQYKKSFSVNSTESSSRSDGAFHLTEENYSLAYTMESVSSVDDAAILQSKKRYLRMTVMDWQQGNFEQKLQSILHKISIKSLPIKQLFAGKNSGVSNEKITLCIDEVISQLHKVGLLKKATDNYLKCLQSIRIEQLNPRQIHSRVKQANIINAEQHSEFLDTLHLAYQHELAQQQAIDFDDMIALACEAIEAKTYSPSWQHILVDEFQDISAARYKLLDCLVKAQESTHHCANQMNSISQNIFKRQAKLTVVGDDWQSIYRFSGGKLELTTRFKQCIGSYSLSKLQKTFRYNNSIADIAGQFVMKNPEQYRKTVITHTQVNSPQVFLHDDNVTLTHSHDQLPTENATYALEEKVKELIKLLTTKEMNTSVVIVARYRSQLTKIENFVNSQIELKNYQISFLTYHSAKGLEADHAILVGFEKGYLGFPAENKNDLLIESLLPSLDSFPYTEERRLLYVGLTRAKHQAHLIANTKNYSAFISELIEGDYDINICSPFFNHMKNNTKIV